MAIPGAEHDFRIGEWLVQPDRNLVSNNGAVIHLEPKVMLVLLCLAEHAGEVVAKERILREVWEGSFVTEQVLTHAIWQLRQAIGNGGGRSEVIETVPKRGYRLVAEVAAISTAVPTAAQVTLPDTAGSVRQQRLVPRRYAFLVAIAFLIAAAIVAELARMAKHDKPAVTGVHVANREAQELCHKAAFQVERSEAPGALQQALRLYTAAIEKDSNFAPAYAGMGMAHLQLMMTDQQQIHFENAERAAQRAIALDSNLPEGYLVLARLRAVRDWDWAAADEAFRRGIALHPTHSVARGYYVAYLTSLGRFEEAIQFGQATLEQEPYSRFARTMLAQAYLYADRTEEALAVVRRNLELEPDFTTMHTYLALLYLNKDPERAIAESRKITSPDVVTALTNRVAIAGCAGKPADGRKLLPQIEELGKTQHLRPTSMARMYVCLGDTRRAIAWLNKGFEEHDVLMPMIATGPWFAPIRHDPEFVQILRRMNYPSP